MGEAERFFTEALGLNEGDQPSPCTARDQDDRSTHQETSNEAFCVELAALTIEFDAMLADLRGTLRNEPRHGTLKGFFRGHGWDVLAFYRPFHASRATWGIHYRLDRMMELEARVLDHGLTTYAFNRDQAFGDLIELTRLHELFHFRTEFALTHAEVAADRALYCALREWYRKTFGTRRNLAEALATATKFREGRGRHPELVDLLTQWAVSLPGGYRHWDAYADDDSFRAGLRALMSVIVQGSWPGTGELLEHDVARAYESSVPEYLLVDPAHLPPWAVQVFGAVMAAAVRTLPIKKVERHARRNGATIDTGRGGHGTYVELHGQKVPLAKHGAKKEIVHFEIKSLAQLFGMERDAYVYAVLTS